MVVTIISTATNVIGLEVFIFIALMFYLLYLANSYENIYLKLALKLFSTLIAVSVSYIVLIPAGLADQPAMYDSFAFNYMWGFIIFWFVWFVVFLWEMFTLFQNRNKETLEDIQ